MPKRKKQKQIKIKHKGSLKRLGYDPDYKTKARHIALGKAVKKYGYKRTVAKLNAVRVLTKRKNKKYSKIYERDLHWLQKRYGGKR